MFNPKTLWVAAALATTTLTAAKAADYSPFAPAAPPEATSALDIGSGWYLRGDVGYTDFVPPREDKSRGFTGAPLKGLGLEDTYSLGGGVGYRLTSWLRIDVTGDYRGVSKFGDKSSRTNFGEGYNQESGRFQTTTYMANAYVDLGTWYGFTPYVGGGVGLAQHRFSGVYSQTYCSTITCGDPMVKHAIGYQNDQLYRPNKSRDNLAWALMAGVSTELGSGLTLDVGYRYINMGRAQTGFDSFGFNTRLKDIEANEVRVGVRWAFGAPVLSQPGLFSPQ